VGGSEQNLFACLKGRRGRVGERKKDAVGMKFGRSSPPSPDTFDD
jgi:hypothetical protein